MQRPSRHVYGFFYLRQWIVLALLVLGTAALLPARFAYSQDDTGPIHVVQAGETLYSIARAYDVDVDDLMALNDIANPDAIIEGQKLILPARATAPVGTDQHRVAAGETLSSIARRHGISLSALMLLNQIEDPDAIIVGQILLVAGDTATTPSLATPAGTSTADAAHRHAGGTDPAQTPAQTPTPTPAPTLRTAVPTPSSTPPANYRVQTGDTLYGISRRFGVPAALLTELNDLDEAGTIYEGQVLLLRTAARPQPSATPPTSAPQPDATQPSHDIYRPDRATRCSASPAVTDSRSPDFRT